MTDRSDLTRMIREASTGAEQARAVAALDEFDRRSAALAAADRETDLGAEYAARRLAPVTAHERHTAATDWLAEYDAPAAPDHRVAMIAEASAWYRGLAQAVKEDRDEFSAQAHGRARTLASAYARRGDAEQEFLSVVGYLRAAEAASGLPQIDQTVDANNQPSATPYPTEVFENFAPPQDPFNGAIEGMNHDSQVDSTHAPLIQQVMQQQNGGSGFGSGPEKPDSHTTQFDSSGGYAEVPLGAPGQIPAQSVQGPGTSAPNPVAGTQQDEGAERRQATAAVEGWSMPDPYGYRWMMTPEVVHPFHEKCASAHWPDEACGDRAHTASVAVGYATDIDQARRAASCERVGVREGLKAVGASHSAAELGQAHNRFSAAWGNSGQTLDDTAVLHGFFAVVRPVLAELEHQAAMTCTGCKGGDCASCSDPDCACAKHPKGHSRSAAKAHAYVEAMAREFGN